MQIRIKKIGIVCLLEYILIGLIVINSGSIIGWQTSIFNEIKYVLLLFGFIYCMYTHKRKISKENIIVFIIVSIICILNLEITDANAYKLLTGYYVYVPTTFLAATIIDREGFFEKYSDIISIIALVSIICFLLTPFGITFGAKVKSCNNGVLYLMNPFYIYGSFKTGVMYGGFNHRNQGIFWEPGAFQAFLNLGLLGIFLKDNWSKWDKLKITILVITVITTFSTTAYIVLILLLILLYHKKTKKILKIRYILMALVIMIIIIVLLNSSTVINKFSSNNLSYNIRLNDMLSGLKIILRQPFIGYGYASPTLASILDNYCIEANSVGIFIMAQYFGIPATIYFFYLMVKHLSKICKVKDSVNLSLIIIFLLIIFLTESFMTTEIFVLFMFIMSDTYCENDKK